MNIGLPVSPGRVPQQNPQPVPDQLPLLQGEAVCTGAHCKLPQRRINPGQPRTEFITYGGRQHTLCYHCLIALDGQPDRFCANNDLWANGLKHEGVE